MFNEADVKKYMDQFCIEEKPEPCALIIFGASGDLVGRKLIPSLFNLYRKRLLPGNFYIFGFARTTMNTDAFRQRIKKILLKKNMEVNKSELNSFLQICYYQSGKYTEANSYDQLGKNLLQLDREYSTRENHIFYMATPPVLYGPIVLQLGEAGLVSKSKVVIEKPFGKDLKSALELNEQIYKVLSEDQIYRIDHYLGKETVQNILMFRFANRVFEPIWNKEYIDHIQITVAESIGVGHRAGYYEEAGQLRDMFQNHMLQMLALVAMEEPASFGTDSIRDRKVQLLRAIKPAPINELGSHVVRAQYGRGVVHNEKVAAYRDERGVAKDSTVETYVAGKLMLDTPRWEGVPFYLRSGKRFPKKVSEISMIFKPAGCRLFSNIKGANIAPNILTLNVQPDEGVSLVIQAKHPGPKLCMSSVNVDFCYKDIFGSESPEAYQRLLLDCMLGDQTLFVRRDGMEVAWSLITPILEKWKSDPEADPLYFYPSGTRGPEEADRLIEADGRSWFISKRACK